MEGNLQEIMEINNKIYGGEYRKATNKAENDLKKAEDAAKAAQDAIDLWDKEPDLILEELDEASNQPKTPFNFVRTPTILTPTAPPVTPITPINHMGNKNGSKQNAKSNNNQNGNNNNKNKNKNKNKESTWAEISKLIIPTEVMETKDPREYAQKVADLNKIVPNHIPEGRNPEAARKPKIAADMELSLIHISEPRDMRRSRMPSSA